MRLIDIFNIRLGYHSDFDYNSNFGLLFPGMKHTQVIQYRSKNHAVIIANTVSG